MVIIVSVVFGLIIGSFLTVCIYRLPYGRPKGPPDWDLDDAEDGTVTVPETTDESVPAEAGSSSADQRLTLTYPPRSFCPHCRNQLKWFHNIPLFSWLFLGGKCAFCKASISFRYPLVEVLSALFAALSVHWFGVTLTGLGVYLFCCMLIVISFIDIEYYIIPDAISLPGCVLGLVVSLVNQYTHVLKWPFVPTAVDSLLGLIFGGGVLYVIAEGYFRLRKREGLGLGDVKLLGLTGAFFGLPGALYTMFIGSLLGSIIGIVLILVSGKRMTYQLPFGPYLALGTIVYLFFAAYGPFWFGPAGGGH